MSRASPSSSESQSQSQPFSVAALLADAFVTSKLAPLLMLACLILGLLSLSNTPREDNPQIVIPGASVQVTLPGASAEEVEQLIVRPVEGAIRLISGVDDFYSTATNSVAVFTVQFEVGEDQEASLVKLHDRMEEVKPLLPLDAGAPVIRTMNVDDVPIVTVTLASVLYDDYALKRVADRLTDGLRTMADVSAVYVKGGRDRQIRVELNPDRMQGFGITLDRVRQVLAASNLSAPLGQVVQAGERQQVFLDGYLTSAAELETLVVDLVQGRSVYLGDIADIVDGPVQERDQLSRFGYGPADPRYGQWSDGDVPAVTLAVAKQRGTNAVVVAQSVLARVEAMRQQFVPADMDLVVTRNDGQIADDTANELIHHLSIAILAVFLVTLVFLGRKEALIVGMSVPLVLALTLGALYLAGMTINRVSLFGLILSLGLLVDDAIVVIENVHRKYACLGQGDKRQATVDAAGEIGNPTNLATVAVMAVFGSLVMVSGMIGEYFYPIAFTVPVAMAASLLIAYTVVPWAARRWLHTHECHGEQAGSDHRGLGGLYHRLLAALLARRSRRVLATLLVVLSILLSVLQPGWQFLRPAGIEGPQAWFGVETTMMPLNDKNTFVITVDMPETTPLETTDQLMRALAEELRRYPEVADYQLWIGQSGIPDFSGLFRGSADRVGSHLGEVRVNLRHKDERDLTSMAIVRDLRPRLLARTAAFPGATIQVLEDPPGPPVRANLLAEIYGADSDTLRWLSGQVKVVFADTWDVAEVNDSEPEDVTQMRLVVDREKAALSGLTTADVVTAMRRLIDGEYLGRAHVAGEKNPVPMQLLIPRRHQLDVAQLSRAYVTNPAGVKVPLSELVKVQPSVVDRPIHHKNGARVTYVTGEMTETAPVYAVLAMNRKLDGLALPDGGSLSTGNLTFTPQEPDPSAGYTLLWDGAQRQMLDTYRDMLSALGMAIIFIFLCLVAYYQSFSLPVVALAAIPLGLAGIFPGHWLMQSQFSATSMVGVIALAGVVVRNSLLIIDFVQENQRQGMSLENAILEAGALRLRPILLTALSIVLGSAIMLKDPLFSGLAISLIFGTIAATVLTLIVVPLMLYALLGRKARRA
ncbi:MAG: efflux RND transporter permease subunit [Pseudomonadota bacterium]|nr:efflux RND transporter permease subunit [Pseudomonadota bacterium]